MSESFSQLGQDIVDVQVRATDISPEDVEQIHRPLIKRAVASAIGQVRRYVPSELNSIKNYFSKKIVYDLESHPGQPHVGGFFIPSTDKLVANTYQLRSNPLFFVEALYHEGKHALRKGLGSMERLYNGFANVVGPFWASILSHIYEEGSASRLTQRDLGKTLDGYGLERAAAMEVERDYGVAPLIYNTESDAKKILPSMLRGIKRHFQNPRAYTQTYSVA